MVRLAVRLVLGDERHEGYSWQEMCSNLGTKELVLSSESQKHFSMAQHNEDNQ